MTVNKIVRLAWVTAISLGAVGGCKCGKDYGAGSGPSIEHRPIIDEEPDAPKPDVVFPKALHSDDPSVTAFVQHVMDVCARGEYDKYRQLFATSYTPTGFEEFKEIWARVKEIRVAGLERGRSEPPRHYMHLIVEYRKPDSKGRSRREVGVLLLREGEDWRLAPAPKEVIEQFKASATAPASSPAMGSPQAQAP